MVNKLSLFILLAVLEIVSSKQKAEVINGVKEVNEQIYPIEVKELSKDYIDKILVPIQKTEKHDKTDEENVQSSEERSSLPTLTESNKNIDDISSAIGGLDQHVEAELLKIKSIDKEKAKEDSLQLFSGTKNQDSFIYKIQKKFKSSLIQLTRLVINYYKQMQSYGHENFQALSYLLRLFKTIANARFLKFVTEHLHDRQSPMYGEDNERESINSEQENELNNSIKMSNFPDYLVEIIKKVDQMKYESFLKELISILFAPSNKSARYGLERSNSLWNSKLQNFLIQMLNTINRAKSLDDFKEELRKYISLMHLLKKKHLSKHEDNFATAESFHVHTVLANMLETIF